MGAGPRSGGLRPGHGGPGEGSSMTSAGSFFPSKEPSQWIYCPRYAGGVQNGNAIANGGHFLPSSRFDPAPVLHGDALVEALARGVPAPESRGDLVQQPEGVNESLAASRGLLEAYRQ